jgi:DNA-binding response OmpR family regulator
MAKLLLVDDDKDLLDVTSYALRREGFQVVPVQDGRKALERFRQERPDLVLLDVGLPGISGFDLGRAIIEEGGASLVFLTARTEEEQVVRGFALGADDYVAKPFSPRQLALRVRAILARGGQMAAPAAGAREVRAGGLVVDAEAHAAEYRGHRARLTPLECRLLHLLAVNAGRVVPHERLVEFAWGHGEAGDSTLLKSHITHLRHKLRLPRTGPGAIEARTGLGYGLVAHWGGSAGA